MVTMETCWALEMVRILTWAMRGALEVLSSLRMPRGEAVSCAEALHFLGG